MKQFLLSMFLMFPLLTVAQTHDYGSGTSLLRECTAATTPGNSDSLNTFEAGLCIGLVRGVMGTMQLWQVERNLGKEPVDMHGCIPHEVEETEAIKVVLKYLNDHPNKLHMDDMILIHMALLEGYPCK